MEDRGEPLTDHAMWERLVREHSSTLFPPGVWGRSWLVKDVPLVPVVRSVTQRLETWM